MFSPANSVKREEFVKMLIGNKADGIEENADNKFSDVGNGAWYFKHIVYAKNNGIVNGISENEFGIGRNITRQDLCVMLYNFAVKNDYEFTEMGDLSDFTDRGIIAEYAYEAINALKGEGIVNGIDANTFAPLKCCTRAEAACLIDRMFIKMNLY